MEDIMLKRHILKYCGKNTKFTYIFL